MNHIKKFNESESVEKVLTADEFYQKAFSNPEIGDDITDLMNAYAKYHVERALKSAIQNSKIVDVSPYQDGGDPGYFRVDELSIINSYPLENIK
jgi:hypothetical protein